MNRQGKKKGSLWNPTKFSCLCHDHFAPEDYRQPDVTVPGRERKRLKADAVPSLKLGTPRSEEEAAESRDTPRAKRKKLRDIRGGIKFEQEHFQGALEDVRRELDQDEQGPMKQILPILHADMKWIGAEEDVIEPPAEVDREHHKMRKSVNEDSASASPVDSFLVENKNTDKGIQTTSISTRSVSTETAKFVPRVQCKISVDMFSTDNVALLFYTGFQNSSHFNFFFSCLEPAVYRLNYKSASLSRRDEVFLTLMKLRCGKPDVELSIMFGISSMVVSLIFSTMIRFLYYHLKDMTPWLPKDVVAMYTPLDFKSKYPGTRVILDGTEFHVQKPSDVRDQSATWSS